LVSKCCLLFPVFEKNLLVFVECSSQTVAKIQLNDLRLLSKLSTSYQQFSLKGYWFLVYRVLSYVQGVPK
jgi:hypothetical protein